MEERFAEGDQKDITKSFSWVDFHEIKRSDHFFVFIRPWSSTVLFIYVALLLSVKLFSLKSNS